MLTAIWSSAMASESRDCALHGRAVNDRRMDAAA
jgi:hypothetical protein